jgi:alcohol dehydrogenase class IV
LGSREIQMFAGVEPNPSIETVEKGAAAAAEFGAELVVGLGGGSALDAAKAIAAVAPNGGRVRPLLGKASYDRAPLAMIAVPTTCGTGSESNQYAILTDLEASDKVNFSSDYTYPTHGVLDSEVLRDIPRPILVSTALDAFTHAFEGFTGRRSQPFADVLAMESMRLILPHLAAAADGDEDAKARLLYASCLAGIVIAHTGTTMLHAMGYYLTLRHDVPHGAANAMLLPVLLDHLQRNIPDKVAAVLSLLPGGKTMEEYLRSLGVDCRLRSCGMKRQEFEPFAQYVLGKKNTPATVGAVDHDVVIALLEKHW